jgi:hypothetical protein
LGRGSRSSMRNSMGGGASVSCSRRSASSVARAQTRAPAGSRADAR